MPLQLCVLMGPFTSMCSLLMVTAIGKPMMCTWTLGMTLNEERNSVDVHVPVYYLTCCYRKMNFLLNFCLMHVHVQCICGIILKCLRVYNVHIFCFIGVTLKQWLRNLVHLKLFSQFCLASKVPAYQLVHAIEHFERISCTLSHLCILSYHCLFCTF